jgi:hypothetical protein
MKKIIGILMVVAMLATPVFAGPVSKTLLSAVTATGASAAYGCGDLVSKTVYVLASSVTSGGTITVDTSYDGTNWVTINTTAIRANGVTEIAIVGLQHRYIRVNLSARTDGTYTVTLFGKD